MTLEEIRNSWERGLETKCVLGSEKEGQLLVVLQSKGVNEWHCHRYFTIGTSWEVSVDGQNITLERVWKWLENPCAAACV